MNLHDFVFAQKDLTNGGSSPTQVHLFIFVDKLNTVEPHYSEPLKCGHVVLTDILLRYGLHFH